MYRKKEQYSVQQLHDFEVADLETELKCAKEQIDRAGFPEYIKNLEEKLRLLRGGKPCTNYGFYKYPD